MTYAILLLYIVHSHGLSIVLLALIVRSPLGKNGVRARPIGANFGEAGSRFEIRRRGDYLSFVTLVELKPNHKFDESNPSYSTPSQIVWLDLTRLD